MEPQLYAQSYKLLCLAGDGGQGQVFLAEKESKTYIIKTYFPSKNVQSYFLAQTQILSFLDSPHIIRLVQCLPQAKVNSGKGETLQPMIVLEFAEHGDLFKLVNKGKICEQASRTMFKQMIKALRCLKEAEVAHLDIKLENIFMDQNFGVKLGDFGYAQRSNFQNHLEKWQGTPGYMAPEVHQGKYKGDKVDLFAMGVSLFIMVVRKLPFIDTTPAHSDYKTIKNQNFAAFWKRFDPANNKISQSFKRLMNSLLNADPQKRPTLSDLQVDEWLNEKSLSPQQVKAYLQPRYNKLQETDQQTKNIRKNLRLKQKMALQNIERQEEHRQRSRQGPIRMSKQPQSFIEELACLPLDLDKLQEKKYYGLSYSKATPKEILLWLVQYLNEVKKQKKLFFDSAEILQFNDFSLQIKSTSVQLIFEIEVRSENDFWTIELGLQGEIVRWNKEVSIFWKKMKGNHFWLSQIVDNIQNEFIKFFQTE